MGGTWAVQEEPGKQKPRSCRAIIGDVIFPHPDGLYKEYKAVKRDDSRHQALLRRWDFSVLAGVADTIDERSRIALREHKAV
jgi:hypothetical protein